ncbi:hypothetical protein JB92DRAFT_2832269 [Gautieria morchelliformis]|nr:hypothetical protein JB92DRAFT_2832269 [Gautieria morchelliformis]
MGQPDARTLLGLLPDLSDSIKLNELLNVWNQPEGREDASQGSGSKVSVPNSSMLSRESSKGFLEAQKVQAKASSKQKLQSRLEMERDNDSEAMPPPPLPVIRSAGTSQRPSLACSDLSQRKIARQATSSQRPRSTEQSGTGSSACEHPVLCTAQKSDG